MKSLIKILVFIAIFSFGAQTKAGITPPMPHASFSFFYDFLSPHGEWIELNDGLLVWRPLHMRSNWTPYAYGTWVWTNNGWYWDSNEEFGEVVYHYGRWYNDDYYGWLWVPDYDWAPAWVQWRYDNDYIGWTPLSPYARFGISTGIYFSSEYSNHFNHWNFVPMNRFCSPYVVNYFIRERIKSRIFGGTKERHHYGYANNSIINHGIEREFIEKRSRTAIIQRDISFREGANANEKLIRSNGRNIEVGIPKAETRTRDYSKVNITRGDRNTTIEVKNINIGTRRSELGRTDAGSGTKERGSSPVETTTRNRLSEADAKKPTTVIIDKSQERIDRGLSKTSRDQKSVKVTEENKSVERGTPVPTVPRIEVKRENQVRETKVERSAPAKEIKREAVRTEKKTVERQKAVNERGTQKETKSGRESERSSERERR